MSYRRVRRPNAVTVTTPATTNNNTTNITSAVPAEVVVAVGGVKEVKEEGMMELTGKLLDACLAQQLGQDIHGAVLAVLTCPHLVRVCVCVLFFPPSVSHSQSTNHLILSHSNSLIHLCIHRYPGEHNSGYGRISAS